MLQYFAPAMTGSGALGLGSVAAARAAALVGFPELDDGGGGTGGTGAEYSHCQVLDGTTGCSPFVGAPSSCATNGSGYVTRTCASAFGPEWVEVASWASCGEPGIVNSPVGGLTFGRTQREELLPVNTFQCRPLNGGNLQPCGSVSPYHNLLGWQNLHWHAEVVLNSTSVNTSAYPCISRVWVSGDPAPGQQLAAWPVPQARSALCCVPSDR